MIYCVKCTYPAIAVNLTLDSKHVCSGCTVHEEKLKVDSDYFSNLSKGQDPNILYIGCSDSRVTAEELMGGAPGDVFVHRNILLETSYLNSAYL